MEYLNLTLQIIFYYIVYVILCIRSEIPNPVFPLRTNFSCLDRAPGFYADVDASCKVYHTCDEYGNKFTYRCPEETAFRQDALICDHAHLVDCYGCTLFKKEETIGKRQSSNSSDAKDLTDDSDSLLPFPTLKVVQQPTKEKNEPQRGFAFSSAKSFKNLNETEGTKSEIMKSLHSVINPLNSSPNVFFNRPTNISTSHASLLNQNQQSGLRKNANFSTQYPYFNDKTKFSEKEKVNQKTNNTSYNYSKPPSNTFPENIQNVENNINNHQTSNSFRSFLKPFFMNHRNHPYLETLKSIQKNTKTSLIKINTTIANTFLKDSETPTYALTLSLKPLVPSELEYDPYYPRPPTSTEVYYTQSFDNKKLMQDKISTQTSRFGTHLQLPSALPDLNVLEDIVDRRKLFYISRIKSN